MKNVLILILSLLIVVSTNAQKVKKPNINKAKTMWIQGKLDEAKVMIDAATTHEKTMNNGNTWYYRGLIYATIDTTSNENFQKLSDNARETALMSFAKADELADEGKSYFFYEPGGALPVTMEQQISNYYAYYFGLGAEAYEKEEMVKASELFEIAWTILPTDTSAIVNAAYAAQRADDIDRTLEMFQKTIESGGADISIYYNIIFILNTREDWESSLEWVRKGKELYPFDTELGRFEVTDLLNLDKIDEAIEQLKEVIAKEPNDPALRFSLALLYDQADKIEMAVEGYESALEIDPDHYASNYNLAVIKFNNANVIYKEWAKLTTSDADEKKGNELKPKINKEFTSVLPIWEKAYKIKSDDESTLSTLMFIYSYLNMNDEADKMEEELIALTGE